MEMTTLNNVKHTADAVSAAPEADAEQRWLALGLESHRAGRLHEAEKAYKALLAEVPNSADGLNLSGVLIKDGRGDLNLAAAMIEAALDLHPERAAYWHNLGGVRQSLGDFLNAEHCFRRALALQPEYPSALLGLADALLATGRSAQSRACVEDAIGQGMQQPAILARAGALLAGFGEVVRAEILYRRAIELAPEDQLVRSYLSVLLLREGRLEEGWKVADSRFSGDNPRVPLPLAALNRWPRWQGEPLAGKRLLLTGEQGYGDIMQFVRYAKLLHAQGATVDVAGTFPCLEALISTVPDVRKVYAELPEDGDYDYWVAMMSVPGLVGTTLETIPAVVPYLFADTERAAAWRKRLTTKKFKVGLAWAGFKGHANDLYRSMRLADLRPLAEVPGVAWYSLQVGNSASAYVAAQSMNWRIEDLGAELSDFADTAAVVENLDLVITVDTSVAHLAGAMGKPVWTMLPAWGVDWRWLRGRIDSPWYPSMHLFRQAEPRQWGEVVAQVAAALGELAGATNKARS